MFSSPVWLGLLAKRVRRPAHSPDQQRVAQSQSTAFDPCEGDREWLEQGALLVGDGVWNLVEPCGRVEVVPGEGTVVGRCGCRGETGSREGRQRDGSAGSSRMSTRTISVDHETHRRLGRKGGKRRPGQVSGTMLDGT